MYYTKKKDSLYFVSYWILLKSICTAELKLNAKAVLSFLLIKKDEDGFKSSSKVFIKIASNKE